MQGGSPLPRTPETREVAQKRSAYDFEGICKETILCSQSQKTRQAIICLPPPETREVTQKRTAYDWKVILHGNPPTHEGPHHKKGARIQEMFSENMLMFKTEAFRQSSCSYPYMNI